MKTRNDLRHRLFTQISVALVLLVCLVICVWMSKGQNKLKNGGGASLNVERLTKMSLRAKNMIDFVINSGFDIWVARGGAKNCHVKIECIY